MKINTLTLISALLLALGLLIGCGDVAETSTDVKNASSAVSVVQQYAQEQEKVLVEEEKQGDASSSNRVQSEVQKQENTNQNTSSQTAIQAMPPEYVPPCFTSMEGFHTWLQDGGGDDEKRSELLSCAKNSPTFSLTSYYRPKMLDGKDGLQLSEIAAYSTGIHYYYGYEKNKENLVLDINVSIHKAYLDRFAEDMQDCYNQINHPDGRVFDKYGEAVVNGITYQYYHYPKNDSTTV